MTGADLNALMRGPTRILIRETLTPRETFFTACLTGDDEDEPDFAEANTEEGISEAALRKARSLGLRLGDVQFEHVTEVVG